jgi:hypothetical protein
LELWHILRAYDTEILQQLIVVKDAIVILFVGLGALVLAALLKMLLWLSNALVLGLFLLFCWWYLRLPVHERVQLRMRFTGIWRLIRALKAR